MPQVIVGQEQPPQQLSTLWPGNPPQLRVDFGFAIESTETVLSRLTETWSSDFGGDFGPGFPSGAQFEIGLNTKGAARDNTAPFELMATARGAAVRTENAASFRWDTLPPFEGSCTVQAPLLTLLPPPPAGLPSYLALGLQNGKTQLGWMQNSGVPWNYRYSYLNSGWTGWDSPSGQFASNYLMQGIPNGYVPVFTFNEIEGQGFLNEAARESWLRTPANMLGYFNDFQLLLQKIAGAGGWDASRAFGSMNATVSNDNSALTYTGANATNTFATGASFRSAGKWIFSITFSAVNSGSQVGLADANAATGPGRYLGLDTHSVGTASSGTQLIINNTLLAGTVPALVANQQVDVAVDLTAQLFWQRVGGGNWNASPTANPATGQGGISIAGLAGYTLSPGVQPYNNGVAVTFNAPPTIAGFSPWNIAAPPAIVHIEPDLSGFVQQNWGAGGANFLAVSVASSGYTGVAAVARLRNTFAGFAQALILIRNAYAPGVLLAWHMSLWGPNNGYDPTNSGGPSPQATADQLASFYAGLGTSFDLLFHDPSDADSAYKVLVRGNPIASAWWTVTAFASYQAYLAELCTRTGLRGFLWQIPGGNTKYLSCNNTPYHYQDNRPEYFLNSGGNGNLLFFALAGIVGLLFGAGGTSTTVYNNSGQAPYNPAPISDNNTGSTTSLVATLADDDGGGLQVWSGNYYAGPLYFPGGQATQTEAGTAARADPAALAETLFMARIDPAAAGEALLTARADPPMASEALRTQAADPPVEAEATAASARTDALAPTEYLASHPVGGALRGDFFAPIEVLSTARSDNAPVEWAAVFRSDMLPPLEVALFVRADPAVQIEDVALYRADLAPVLEALSAARGDAAAPIEALLAALRSGALAEFGLALRLDPLLPAEAGETVRNDPNMPAEAGANAARVDMMLPFEALLAVRGGNQAPAQAGFEWLSTVRALLIYANSWSPVETAEIDRSDAISAVESTSRWIADSNALVESVRSVMFDTASQATESSLTPGPPKLTLFVTRGRLR
jgi:hypothetical protein